MLIKTTCLCDFGHWLPVLSRVSLASRLTATSLHDMACIVFKVETVARPLCDGSQAYAAVTQAVMAFTTSAS